MQTFIKGLLHYVSMVNWKYIMVGIGLLALGLYLYLPYNLIFGAGSYLDNMDTLFYEGGLYLFGFVTICVGIGK